MPEWLMRRDEISSGAKLCYAAIYTEADENGKYPHWIRELAVIVDRSSRHTKRCLRELREHGLIYTRFLNDNKHVTIFVDLNHKWME